MVDHVVAIEGPIYLDVLVNRIARAHGFMRSGEVQKIVMATLGRERFRRRTKEPARSSGRRTPSPSTKRPTEDRSVDDVNARAAFLSDQLFSSPKSAQGLPDPGELAATALRTLALPELQPFRHRLDADPRTVRRASARRRSRPRRSGASMFCSP